MILRRVSEPTSTIAICVVVYLLVAFAVGSSLPLDRIVAAKDYALAEAAERRKAAQALDLPTELGGRDGPEPVRYGDWEKKGIAIDF